jgi:hypothetical protein
MTIVRLEVEFDVEFWELLGLELLVVLQSEDVWRLTIISAVSPRLARGTPRRIARMRAVWV